MSWDAARAVMGNERVLLGASASHQWRHAPEHLAMVLARYRAAAALCGTAEAVLEVGCGEGIGSAILARGREAYTGVDSDPAALDATEALAFDFADADATAPAPTWAIGTYDAVVALDVIEHIPPADEAAFMAFCVSALRPRGVCVVGTPSAAFLHLASPESRAGHVNLYRHDRLHALMARHFHVVQSFGMQDVALHLGHPDARHYLLMAGIGPR
jgi:2-polyprenyl-3-methyl-5-hydroxy-6-metoxy-1,4-benzoquinol methylase